MTSPLRALRKTPSCGQPSRGGTPSDRQVFFESSLLVAWRKAVTIFHHLAVVRSVMEGEDHLFSRAELARGGDEAFPYLAHGDLSFPSPPPPAPVRVLR